MFLDKYSGINTKLSLQLAYSEGLNKRDEDKTIEVNSDAGSVKEEEEIENVGVYLKAFCSAVNELLTVYK